MEDLLKLNGDSMETGFYINFLDFPKTIHNPTKDMFSSFFLDYSCKDWNSGAGASFDYFDKNNKKYSLVISQDPRYGFNLMYEPSENGCYSLGNRDKLDEFVENYDEIIMPLGTYISPKKAWLAVEDFLCNPFKPSSRILWVGDNDIPWGDDF